MLAAGPQSTNEVCDEFTSGTLTALKNHYDYVAINISSDGLSSEQKFLKAQMLKYMNGHTSTVRLMDPNHWGKAC
eukprot:15119843-Ditylum_brightwellii.AAC.1